MTDVKEVRYYKGKYKVEVITKGRGRPLTWRVKASEPIFLRDLYPCVKGGTGPFGEHWNCLGTGETLTTVPRLLWKTPRKMNGKRTLEVELPKEGWGRSVFIDLGNTVHGQAELCLHGDGTFHLSIYQKDSERKQNGNLDVKAYEFRLPQSKVVEPKT